jgi:hypothetical protein
LLDCRHVCKTWAFHDAVQAGKQKEVHPPYSPDLAPVLFVFWYHSPNVLDAPRMYEMPQYNMSFYTNLFRVAFELNVVRITKYLSGVNFKHIGFMYSNVLIWPKQETLPVYSYDHVTHTFENRITLYKNLMVYQTAGRRYAEVASCVLRACMCTSLERDIFVLWCKPATLA